MVEPEARYITNWRIAEENAAAWMTHWGFSHVRLTGAGADEGIDIRADFAIAQVKFGPTRVGRPALQRLVGARANDGELQMLFFSGAGYSPQAVAYAEIMGIGLFTYEDEGAMQVVNRLPNGPSLGLTRRQMHERRLLATRREEMAAASEMDRRNSDRAHANRMEELSKIAKDGHRFDVLANATDPATSAFSTALKAQLESGHRYAQARQALSQPGLTTAERLERSRQIDEDELSDAEQRLASLVELNQQNVAADAVHELEKLSRERVAREAAELARSAAIGQAEARFQLTELSLSRRAHEIRKRSFKSWRWKAQQLSELRSEWSTAASEYATTAGSRPVLPSWLTEL